MYLNDSYYRILFYGWNEESFTISWNSDAIYLCSLGLIEKSDSQYPYKYSLTFKGLWIVFLRKNNCE